MTLEQLKQQFPEYANDIKLNLSNLLTLDNSHELKQNQLYGLALASAYASKNEKFVNDFYLLAKEYLTENEIKGIKAAVTIMAMNNIYYRFTHIVSEKEYSKMPAKLRMNIIANPGIEKVDFELYCLAVSMINGCGKCMDAHISQLEKIGISKNSILMVARIAAVIFAATTVTSLK